MVRSLLSSLWGDKYGKRASFCHDPIPISTPVLLDDATAMRHLISSITITLEVTLEGAFARNYNQVSQEANLVLQVSCGPSMISFGLITKYLLHGILLCCPLPTGFGLCSLPSRSSRSSPIPRFFAAGFTLYASKPLPSPISIVLRLSFAQPISGYRFG